MWRVSGNVSRVLQTRKTIKIAWWFRQIHYNRDLYTNWHPSAVHHLGSVSELDENNFRKTRSRKLLGAESSARNMFLAHLDTAFKPKASSVAARDASGEHWLPMWVFWWICHKSNGFMTCLPEGNHMYDIVYEDRYSWIVAYLWFRTVRYRTATVRLMGIEYSLLAMYYIIDTSHSSS